MLSRSSLPRRHGSARRRSPAPDQVHREERLNGILRRVARLPPADCDSTRLVDDLRFHPSPLTFLSDNKLPVRASIWVEVLDSEIPFDGTSSIYDLPGRRVEDRYPLVDGEVVLQPARDEMLRLPRRGVRVHSSTVPNARSCRGAFPRAPVHAPTRANAVELRDSKQHVAAVISEVGSHTGVVAGATRRTIAFVRRRRSQCRHAQRP